VITAAALDEVAAALGDRAQRNAPLGPLTTYRVGGPAAVLVVAASVAELRRVGVVARVAGVPILVLGRGSNMLVSDRGFAGVVVTLGEFASTIDIADTTVTAGAAVSLPVLARRTVAAGLTGLEWMVGVPGSVGGAVRMNAGGHGSDVATSLAGVRVLDLATGDDTVVEPSALGLRFRGSDLGDRHVIAGARFRLAAGDRQRSEEELAEIVRWRREHQPGGQNCGSVFVNPVPFQLSAGEVIDELGLRGLRVGSAHVSEKHANFIQADEGGSAEDVRALMATIRARVWEQRGIALRSEVRLVGFDDEAVPA
jgi:UDP-N-acetylmuramate dehydrogenase